MPLPQPSALEKFKSAFRTNAVRSDRAGDAPGRKEGRKPFSAEEYRSYIEQLTRVHHVLAAAKKELDLLGGDRNQCFLADCNEVRKQIDEIRNNESEPYSRVKPRLDDLVLRSQGALNDIIQYRESIYDPLQRQAQGELRAATRAVACLDGEERDSLDERLTRSSARLRRIGKMRGEGLTQAITGLGAVINQCVAIREEVRRSHPADYYQAEIDHAATDITRCEGDPLKASHLTPLLVTIRTAMEGKRYHLVPDAIDGIRKLAGAKGPFGRPGMQGASDKTEDGTKQTWKKQHEEWAAAIDPKDFSAVKRLKEGAFGVTFLMKDDTGRNIVTKMAKGGDTDELYHEAEIYEAIGPHPNIARCKGVVDQDGMKMLVMEALSGGDMKEVLGKMTELRNKKKLRESEYWGMIQFSFKKSLEALAFMQEAGVVHRDIKPDNIAYDLETGEPKLIDMGLAGGIDPDGDHSREGTDGFIPHHDDDRTRDAFSIGASAFEVAEGNLGGLYGKPGDDFRNATMSPRYKPEVADSPDDASAVEDAVRQKRYGMYASDTAYTNFLGWLLNEDKDKRPSPAEALSHPFLQDALLDDDTARGTLLWLLNPDKNRRPGIPLAQDQQDALLDDDAGHERRAKVLDELKKTRVPA